MRWRSAGTKRFGFHLRILGTHLSAGFLCPNIIRFCPQCLKDDGILGDMWCIKYVVACHKHGCLLVDRCQECDTPFVPIHSSWTWSCICGKKMITNRKYAASPSVVRCASNIASFVAAEGSAVEPDDSCTHDIAPPFDNWKLQDYLAAIHTIGIASTTPADADQPLPGIVSVYGRGSKEPPVSTSVICSRIDAATAVLDDWPTAYHRLLGEVAHRNQASEAALAGRRAFATRIGESLLHPIRGANGLTLAILCAEIDKFCANNGDLKKKGRTRTVHSSVAYRLHYHINNSLICKRAGFSPRKRKLNRILSYVYDKLTPNDLAMNDLELTELVSCRVLSLNQKIEISFSTYSAAALEGSRHRKALVGWHHPRLLLPDPELDSQITCRKVAYTHEAIEGILDKIAAVTVRIEQVMPHLSPLGKALQGAHINQWYGKTNVLLDIIDGVIIVYSLVERPCLANLFVDRILLKDRANIVAASARR
jgi:hypothetical protein